MAWFWLALWMVYLLFMIHFVPHIHAARKAERE